MIAHHNTLIPALSAIQHPIPLIPPARLPHPQTHLALQNPHLSPLLYQPPHPLPLTLRRHQLAQIQQLKLFPKREEMGEQRVKVRLDGEVQDVLEMRVVEVREYAEEVFVYVFGSVCKGWREIAA